MKPDFAQASEIFWGRAFPLVDVSYVRMNDIDMGSTALRYTFPEWTSTITAERPWDFNVLKNRMRYGLVWAVRARHYNDSMDDPLTRPLSRCARELIRVRAKHQGVLFCGRFNDTMGAQVIGAEHARYSVFEGMEKPGKACGVVNFGNEKTRAKVAWESGDGQSVEILVPFHPDKNSKLLVEFKLPARTCAVGAKV